MKGNCHSYCAYAQHCLYDPGKDGLDPDRCITRLKLEDYEWDAECAMNYEAEREREDRPDPDDWEE